MIKIALVDDDKNIHKIFNAYFKNDIGTEFYYIDNYYEALATFVNRSFDLYIIDYQIGAHSGIDLLKVLQKEERIYNRAILISGRIDEDSRIKAFNYGVSNIIDKPINFNILKAIIQRNIRMIESTTRSEYRLGELLIDVNRHICTIKVNDKTKEIKLTPTEFFILYELMKNPSIVKTKEKLSFAGKNNNEPMSFKSLEMKIVSLRRKISPYEHYIKTIRGIGYKIEEG